MSPVGSTSDLQLKVGDKFQFIKPDNQKMHQGMCCKSKNIDYTNQILTVVRTGLWPGFTASRVDWVGQGCDGNNPIDNNQVSSRSCNGWTQKHMNLTGIKRILDSGYKTNPAAGLCTCHIIKLMRYGCECGGK